MIIFEDLLWRAVGDQVALAHDIRTFTYGQCFTDVVVSNQHAKTAVAQMLNVELFHQLVGTILTLFVGQVVTNLQDRHQVVVNAETTENGGFLRQIADPATRARAAAED